MLVQNAGKHCSQKECGKPVLCKGFCNGHYLRYRKGVKMEPSIRRQEKGRRCEIEGCEKKHYGNNLCTSHWRAWSRQSTKTKLIEMMGGRCRSCHGIFHPAAFDFHHLDPTKKDFSITNAFNNKPFDVIKKEVEKCVLLCANCHRIEHAGEQYA
jgi:hypothetical protein